VGGAVYGFGAKSTWCNSCKDSLPRPPEVAASESRAEADDSRPPRPTGWGLPLIFQPEPPHGRAPAPAASVPAGPPARRHVHDPNRPFERAHNLFAMKSLTVRCAVVETGHPSQSRSKGSMQQRYIGVTPGGGPLLSRHSGGMSEGALTGRRHAFDVPGPRPRGAPKSVYVDCWCEWLLPTEISVAGSYAFSGISSVLTLECRRAFSPGLKVAGTGGNK